MSYEKFPATIVIIANALSFVIYALGVYITWQLGSLFVIGYIAYCLWCEFNVLSRSCRACYYYGKTCGFGKGKLCKLFFSQKDPAGFAAREISIKDMIPDFLVFLIPLFLGIYALITDFAWPLLVAVVLLPVVSFVGNALVRGQIVCKHCKQRELGCPADKMFNKQTS